MHTGTHTQQAHEHTDWQRLNHPTTQPLNHTQKNAQRRILTWTCWTAETEAFGHQASPVRNSEWAPSAPSRSSASGANIFSVV